MPNTNAAAAACGVEDVHGLGDPHHMAPLGSECRACVDMVPVPRMSLGLVLGRELLGSPHAAGGLVGLTRGSVQDLRSRSMEPRGADALGSGQGSQRSSLKLLNSLEHVVRTPCLQLGRRWSRLSKIQAHSTSSC